MKGGVGGRRGGVKGKHSQQRVGGESRGAVEGAFRTESFVYGALLHIKCDSHPN